MNSGLGTMGSDGGAVPQLSVVVPTHDRAVRLRWLLNALADQTLDRDRWEVVVAHHGDRETLDVIEGHPLAREGRLRAVAVEWSRRGPAAKRNSGWRAARGGVIVFTDDDCRPPPDWLERMHAATVAAGPAVVQGATAADPVEEHVMQLVPRSRTQRVDPPTPWGQTCNIAYPRDLLDRLGGFEEGFPNPGGEDADLLTRATGAGVLHVAAPEALTYHAVLDTTLRDQVRTALRWSGPVYLVKRHPQLRRRAVLRVFWRARHAWLTLALCGLALSRWRRGFVVLALPYVVLVRPEGADSPRQRLSAIRLLPAAALIDAIEVLTLARASVKYRTLFL